MYIVNTGNLFCSVNILILYLSPFNQPATWTVHMGKNNASGFAEYVDEQVRFISELKIHPDFNFLKDDYKFDNDIALIKLDKPVTFNKHTSPLCLVKNSDDMMKSETRCTITGYGISDMINGKIRNSKMRKICLKKKKHVVMYRFSF